MQVVARDLEAEVGGGEAVEADVVAAIQVEVQDVLHPRTTRGRDEEAVALTTMDGDVATQMRIHCVRPAVQPDLVMAAAAHHRVLPSPGMDAVAAAAGGDEIAVAQRSHAVVAIAQVDGSAAL